MLPGEGGVGSGASGIFCVRHDTQQVIYGSHSLSLSHGAANRCSAAYENVPDVERAKSERSKIKKGGENLHETWLKGSKRLLIN